jgi:protein-tyrosine phosphatase
MGCAASTSSSASNPAATQTPSSRSENHQSASEPQDFKLVNEQALGFRSQIFGSAANNVVISKTLMRAPSAKWDRDAPSSVPERFAVNHPAGSVARCAIERLSSVLSMNPPIGSDSVPMQLLTLKDKLSPDRFVPLLEVAAVLSGNSSHTNYKTLNQTGLRVDSKYYPEATNLESFCGRADEKLVEDVFLAVSEALAELHDQKTAHLNLHAGNVLRVPKSRVGGEEYRHQYLLADFGWGLFWSALTVSERTAFFKKGLGDAILPPERRLRGDAEAILATDDVKEDVWALGVLLHKLICGFVPPLTDSVAGHNRNSKVTAEELSFPLKSSSGWTVGGRWVWLLSTILTLDPNCRPSDLRAVRDEFCQRTVRPGTHAIGTPSIPLLQTFSDVDRCCALPSGNSLFSQDSNEDAQAMRPVTKPQSLPGFQPPSTSVLAQDTEQDSQATSLELSGSHGSCLPKGPKSRRESTASRHRLHKLSPWGSAPILITQQRLSLGRNVESFLEESDSIRCVLCGGDMAPLAFSCEQCPDFTLCSGCFVEHGEEHDPEHCILSFTVEPSKEVLAESKRLNSTTIGKDQKSSSDPCGSYVSGLRLFPRTLTILGPRSSQPASKPASGQKLAGDRSGGAPGATGEAMEERIVRECLEQRTAGLELCDLNLTLVPPSMSVTIAVDRISAFLHVTTLDLANNAIKEIPPELCRLFPSLTTFLAGNNQLASFPDTVSELVNLQRLELHRNKLTSMPASIARLNKLQYCSLDDNDLDNIPDFVWEMPSLETVFLAMNPKLKCWPPLHVLVDCLEGVRNLQLGLDNAPSLWNVFRTTVSERCPSLTVVWNKIYPDEILPGRLYLGALRSAQSLEVYEELRIGSVLTVGRGLLPKIMPGMKHFTLDVDDLPGSSIVDRFAPCFQFIDEAPKLKPDAPGVLVHCWAGMSRSATCVIAYLMQKYQWRLADAYAHTKMRREAIHPNDGFMEQLKAYDRHLFPASADTSLSPPGPAPIPEFPIQNAN